MIESIRIREVKQLPNGDTLEVRVDDPLDYEEPGETALHETEHAFVGDENGTGIVEVSIIPQEGSLGHVLFTRCDVVAAAAPHANGRRGTGHDMNIVKSSGMSEGAACSAARRVMSGRSEEIRKIAGFVQKKRYLHGSEFKEAKRKAIHGDDVEIIHTAKNGERRRVTKTGIKESLVLFASFEIPVEPTPNRLLL